MRNLVNKTAMVAGMIVAGMSVLVSGYPQPLSHFKFNEAEGANQHMVMNYGYHGTQGAGHWLYMYTNFVEIYNAANDVQCNVLSADEQGVSGQAGDRALQLPVPDMGADGATGPVKWARAQLVEGASAYDALTGMTVTVWFKAFSPLKKNPALVWKKGSGNYAWAIEGHTGTTPADGVPIKFNTGVITDYASVDGTGTNSSLYAETNEWIFLAWTYNGGTRQVVWYKGGTGTKTTEVVRTATLAAGGIGGSGGYLSIGGRLVNDRPFHGLIDNVRVFGSKTDPETPVLTQEELEGIRIADAVPEPGLAVALIALAAAGRRRKSAE